MAGDSGDETGKGKRTGGRAGKKGLTESEIAEVRRILSQGGLTNKTDSAEDSATAPNPCANQSAGFFICNGSDQEFVTFPAGAGPFALVVINGVPTFAPYTPPPNAAPEQAPAPRENGPDEQTVM